MNILARNFERLRAEGWEKVFDALERVLTKMEIDFYLIGAVARDVWIDHLSYRDKRTTRDVDICVYVRDLVQYKAVQEALITGEGFARDTREPYRLYGPDGRMLDLIPFGDIEHDGTVWLEDPPMELSVLGTKAVSAGAVTARGAFKVITLPGLCVLKLLAWSSKPEWRGKDLEDVYFIFRHYFEISGDALYEQSYDDLLSDDFESDIAAARMLGRQMAEVLRENVDIYLKVRNVLAGLMQNFTEKEVEDLYAADKNDRRIVQHRLSLEVMRGMEDKGMERGSMPLFSGA
jgi:predicted nucleotidyltransferase